MVADSSEQRGADKCDGVAQASHLWSPWLSDLQAMVMAKTSIKTSPAVAATVAALTIAAVAGAAAPGAAAPVPSSIVVIKSAAERSATVVRCGPGGWGDAA